MLDKAKTGLWDGGKRSKDREVCDLLAHICKWSNLGKGLYVTTTGTLVVDLSKSQKFRTT